MQAYLTPKDVAERLQVSDNTARKLMRRMPHIAIGPNGKGLRVTEEAFAEYMRPDPPLPKTPGIRQRGKKMLQGQPPKRAIPYKKAGGE